MDAIPFIDQSFIEDQNDFVELVDELGSEFSGSNAIVPQRHHHEFPNPVDDNDTTLLLMPAWEPGRHAGVKVVSVNPGNAKLGLESVQGTYLFLDAKNGKPVAILDAVSLTAKRTAASSALASRLLSRSDSRSLLMIGTGALSSNLILAHAAVRPIKSVFVWGRDLKKALSVCDRLHAKPFAIRAVEKIEEVISEVDIVSCATLSPTPLVLGELLRDGQHIDLVGAYRPTMRESNDAVMTRGTIFVDTFQNGLVESGDIAIPLAEKIIQRADIKADLFGLCSKSHCGRQSEHEITVFKSVGHALEDLAAAKYFFKKYQNRI